MVYAHHMSAGWHPLANTQPVNWKGQKYWLKTVTASGTKTSIQHIFQEAVQTVWVCFQTPYEYKGLSPHMGVRSCVSFLSWLLSCFFYNLLFPFFHYTQPNHGKYLDSTEVDWIHFPPHPVRVTVIWLVTHFISIPSGPPFPLCSLSVSVYYLF